ncbi:MAG: PSD1 and planctomycete cytochrome C domain-containing protein [Planctomycetota bacterium]
MKAPISHLSLLIRLFRVVVAGLVLMQPGARADESDFSDAYLVLQRNCFECHGVQRQEGGLRLDQVGSLRASGVVVPGDPDGSELIRRISLPRGHEEVMPAIGAPLIASQQAVLRGWIASGADWPADFQPPKHWAYLAPVRPAIQSLPEDSWSRSDLDRLIQATLQAEGFTASAPAPPEELMRRVCFDLTGLPPTPEEVNAYMADPTEERYESFVDDLLRRPQFGERWARPWLDLARYADSHGFQRDDLRDLWAYRDWVIRALNDDMPFDQFTIEQIAGDLLPNATESQRIATGFHRCAPTNCEAGSLPEETRAEQLIDRVNTTSSVWLGSTLECAQCHDHKYDPFTMKDYYQLLAFFNHTAIEADRTNPQQPSSIAFLGPFMALSGTVTDAERDRLTRQIEITEERLRTRRTTLESDLSEWFSALRRVQPGPDVHVLDVQEVRSLGSSDTFEVLEDGSVLIRGGDPPSEDVYTVTLKTDENIREAGGIRAFRLEALTHESLPGSGPGRGDPKRSNFVLNEFTVAVNSGSVDQQPLRFASAQADFSQAKWDVAGAVDGQRETGWAIAPQFGKPHWAIFVLSEPLKVSQEQTLTIRMDQHFGNARTIGCFRISAVTGTGDLKGDIADLPEGIAAMSGKAFASLTAGDRKILLNYRMQADALSQQADQHLASLRMQLEKLAPATTLVMVEQSPRESYMFERGDYRKRGPRVEPGTPVSLHPMPDGPPNRLTLARWLVDPSNPLVARVVVNRWWAEIFGEGLVTTPEDFGVKGERPSHPELLDWLACEFVEHNWSMKHVLKTIVMSSTYRQASRLTPELSERDGRNRLLARGPRFRLDAEMIRDNALAVSGLLNPEQFGPPIRPPQPEGLWNKVGGTQYDYEVTEGAGQYRRGIYVVLKRSAPYPGFVNFDATSRLTCTVRRSRTNTPLQALTLLNDPVYVKAAQALAVRVLSEHPDEDVASQLTRAFQLCTSRRPNGREVAILESLLHDQTAAWKQSPENASRIAAAMPGAPGKAPEELAAWASVASVLLNLHETITR